MRVEIKLPDQDIFSVKEVARALNVHLSTAWRFLLHGVRGHKLSSFLIGARRRIGRVDLLAWLEAINNDRHDAVQDSRRDQRARQDRQAEQVEKALSAEGF